MKKTAIILLALALVMPAMAQGRFGKDSAECVKYLSYYSELVKQNNLKDAAPSWRMAFSICPPTANQNMIINGQKIIRYEIAQNVKNPERVKQLVDTLILLHDTRAKYYPKYAVKSLDNKAIDIVNFCGADYKKVFETNGPILDQIKGNASPVVFVKQMQAAVDMYKHQQLSAEDVMESYNKYADMLDEKIDSGNSPEYRSAKQDVESVFIESGVASCDNLVSLYGPRYAANPADENLLKSMVKMLTKSECMNTELFLKSVESLNEIDPSASSTYALYKLYSSRDENTKAAEALEKAISLLDASETETASNYNMELATYYFKKCGRNAAAVAKAKAVAESNEALKGKAYLLIGTIWGSSKCGGDEVASRAPFWVAIDYMQKAKAADPSLEDEANGLISQYRRYFPNAADAFMYDVVEGDGYTVSCGGMTERTTVRLNKD